MIWEESEKTQDNYSVQCTHSELLSVCSFVHSFTDHFTSTAAAAAGNFGGGGGSVGVSAAAVEKYEHFTRSVNFEKEAKQKTSQQK